LIEDYHHSERANGLAHLPPMMARQHRFTTTSRLKNALRTSAEGGQVEPVLARFFVWE